MDDLHKFVQRNQRRILAAGGLVLSLLAFSILLNNSPGSSIWMATTVVPAGAKLTAGEVKLTKANLAGDASHYQSGTSTVVGGIAVRRLQPGDLISATDITTQSSTGAMTVLPIGVGVNDLPADLTVGDFVDLYVIPKDSSVLPGLVAHHVAIQSVDEKSRALGGNVAVSVAATPTVVATIITAESQGRLVLARVSF